MGVDLRDLLRAELRIHPRLVQQGLFTRIDARARIAAAIPPLIPFAESDYAGGIWIVDWDHRIPSRHAVLRLYAYYTQDRQKELEQAHAARLREIDAEDLFPEFDVSDFAGLPADEAYEAETDLGGSPSRLRLVSEWRRQIQPNASSRAIDIVRASAPFRELRGQGRVRPAGLGDLEPAEWSPPCESGHVRWALDVWYLLTFNGMVGEGRAFLVDLVERQVVRERDFQFRAG
ncbi:MAG TPA: hypothetical protein VKQ32_01715 [Polyangia bacterium]|nr:hypothetical protein [Polyangia bacterium]